MPKNHTIKQIITITILSTLITTLLSGYATTENTNIETTPASIIDNPVFTSESKVVRISTTQPSTILTLIKKGITILHIDDYRDSAVLSVSAMELSWLNKNGYNPELLNKDDIDINSLGDNPDLSREFHNYASMTTELQNIASTYPHIANLYILGYSVLGRTIWGLKISDNPDAEENEPEVRICGAHHGNELMSVEIPLLLSWYLVQNYSSSSYIENLVNNREIWIIPMVNPDGREMVTRYNANGVDLNRDYGYMWDGSGDSVAPFSQPETQAIRTNALDNNFVLSLSFHTSGDIVNYIWNYKGEPVPDHAIVELLSLQYGSHNGYWVVEGYDWYQTRGDTNDFSYGCRGDIDWTIEIQNNNIQEAWDLNREAILEIIDAADIGLTGVVTDVDTGLPVAATIWVEELYWPCFNDIKVGDYHRILPPGTYTVHFRANGYEEQTHVIEVLNSDDPTVFNVSLSPIFEYYAYQVTWCNFFDPNNYPNNFQNNPTEPPYALGPPDGVFASLGRGGVIVLDMGINGEIINYENASDFIIFEGDDVPEGYHVYAANDWDGPWTYIASGTGTTEFDLADGPLQIARYIKIYDDNDGDPFQTNPGFDLDAVQRLNPPGDPPATPEKPEGPTFGKIGVEYTYSSRTTDPEGDQISYQFDWDDGTFSNWIGPVDSGVQGNASHIWTVGGDYEIRCRAKDTWGFTSDWSEPLPLRIAKPELEISSIRGGIGRIQIDIQNTGDANATDLQWTVDLKRLIYDYPALFNKHFEGSFDLLAIGKSQNIICGLINGFGFVKITVKAYDAEKTAKALILGIFIIILQA